MSIPGRRFSIFAALSLLVLGTDARASGIQRSAASIPLPAKPNPVRCHHRIAAHGTLTIGDEQLPQALHLGSLGIAPSTFTGWDRLGNALFDSLFGYDARGKLVPSMSTTIPTLKNGGIRDGGKTIVLRLRHGMHWSNGAEITSADVRFGWKIDQDPITGPLCASRCNLISAISTPDRYFAVLHLNNAFAPAIPEAMPDLWPVAWPGAWKRGDVVTAARKLFNDPTFSPATGDFPTAGPYRVASFEPGRSVVLQPMPYYTTRSCGAAIAKLTLVNPASHNDLLRGLMAHHIDLAFLPPTDLPAVDQSGNGLTTDIVQNPYLEHLEFNHDPTFDGKPNPLANVDVRVALALAIDKVGLVETALRVNERVARAAAASTFVGAQQLFADRSLLGQWDPIRRAYVQPGTAQALRDAKFLLGRTPFAAGFKVEFYSTNRSPARDAAMAVMAGDWKPLGVIFDPEYDLPAHLYGEGGRGYTGDFQVALFAYASGAGVDDFRFALQSRYVDRRQTIHSLLNGNFAGVNDPVIDAAYNRVTRAFESRVRAASYAVIQQQINREADWVPLYFRPLLVTHDTRIKHFTANLANLYAWKVME